MPAVKCHASFQQEPMMVNVCAQCGGDLAVPATPPPDAFQWLIDEVPQWWKDAGEGITIDVSTGTVYLAGVRLAGRGDYILRIGGKLWGLPATSV